MSIKVFRGFTLLELITFMVVISISFVGVSLVYRQLLISTSAPSIEHQLLMMTESQLTIILSRSYDDVDDFNGYQDQPLPGYQRQVIINYAGSEFSLPHNQVKYIRVESRGPQGEMLQLSTYRANF